MNSRTMFVLCAVLSAHTYALGIELGIAGNAIVLFPSNQEFYFMNHFELSNNIPQITTGLTRIRNYTNWLPGYSLELQAGKLSIFGVDAGFEHLFKTIQDLDTSYNTMSGSPEIKPYDVGLNIFSINAGLHAVLSINSRVTLEPNVAALITIFRLRHHFVQLGYYDLAYSTTKIGILGNLKSTYSLSSKSEIAGIAKILYWPDYFDCFIDANYSYLLHRNIKGRLGIEFSPIHYSLQVALGAEISLFRKSE
jgi:hypothetical protein